MHNFYRELQRRGVLRVAIGYVAGCWLLIQVLETLFPIFDMPDAAIRWLVITLLVCLVPVLAFTWAFEWTSAGFRRLEYFSDGLSEELLWAGPMALA